MRYDIAIIGTGPAGLEAALTAKIRNKTVLLLGNARLSPKVEKAHAVLNYLGLPGVTGAAMRQAFQAHLDQLGIPITEDRIVACYAMGDYFALQGSNTGDMYEASTVILATGVSPLRPLPGEDTLLGRGVSYCATCDGMLYKGRRVAVLGYTPEAEAEANFLTTLATVLYFPQYPAAPACAEAVQVLREQPVAVLGDAKVRQLQTAQATHDVDAVFILRENIAPDKLVPGLALAGNHVQVNLQMETNLTGCFAAGDVTGTPYQYIKAAGQGNVAALSAVRYLDDRAKTAAN